MSTAVFRKILWRPFLIALGIKNRPCGWKTSKQRQGGIKIKEKNSINGSRDIQNEKTEKSTKNTYRKNTSTGKSSEIGLFSHLKTSIFHYTISRKPKKQTEWYLLFGDWSLVIMENELKKGKGSLQVEFETLLCVGNELKSY